MRLFCVCCKSHSGDWNCQKNDFREKKNEIRPMIKIIASSIFIVSVGWSSSLANNSFTHKSVSTSPISFHYPICSAIHPIERSRTKNSQTMANSNKHLSIHFHFCFLSTRFLCFMHHCIPIINCVIIYLYSSFVCLHLVCGIIIFRVYSTNNNNNDNKSRHWSDSTRCILHKSHADSKQ